MAGARRKYFARAVAPACLLDNGAAFLYLLGIMYRSVLKYSSSRRRGGPVSSLRSLCSSLRAGLLTGVRAFTFVLFGAVLAVVFYGTPLFAEDAAEGVIVEEVVVEEMVVPSKGFTAGRAEAPEGVVAQDKGVSKVEGAASSSAAASGSDPLAEEASSLAFKKKWEGNKFNKRHNKYLKYDKYGQVDASPEVIPLDYLPRDKEGFIDWTRAMREGLLQPLAAISAKRGEQMQTVRYDEDVVLRPSKTFMPDVIFPHSAHNDWLNCGNCHDGIFKMKKKASGISMKRIWKGEFCGRCHDKVAFPLRHCFRCHAGERAAKFAEPEPIPDNYIEYEEY
ncbi:hypothetical protein MNBD_DELTA02-217 [hydrothermal vent metagenome]|uniref:Cytochrome c7-like domain-containing protein n=1 Tax=hydrothermal vent metagenome TaxID=652676 RepID=A0A3B0VFE2_9ZZZZ